MSDLSARETTSQRLAAWLPALAGLIAAACVAWWALPHPPPNSLSFSGVAVLSARYVLLSALAGLAVSLAITALLLRAQPPGNRVFNLRVAAAVIWLPPLALYLSQGSVWAGLASMALGWQIALGCQTQKSSRPRTTSAASESRFVPDSKAAGAAICAHAAVLSLMVDKPVEAAACLGATSALIAWSSNRFRVPSEPGPGVRSSPAARRAALAFALALMLTVGGLMRYLRVGGFGGETEGETEASASAAAAQARAAAVAAAVANNRLEGTYRGVVLLSEPAPNTVLLAPLPFLKRDLFDAKKPEPLSVAFSGVYWMFRMPFSQPPAGSYITRGSPLTSVFRTRDRVPLSMEAHQNFGSLIDLRSCGRIQVAVSSADPLVQSIALELILTNTANVERRSMSLGAVAVAPSLDPLSLAQSPPMQSVLTFNVPPRPPIGAFDEATIRFHRGLSVASAKVSIDRFVFVPRAF